MSVRVSVAAFLLAGFAFGLTGASAQARDLLAVESNDPVGHPESRGMRPDLAPQERFMDVLVPVVDTYGEFVVDHYWDGDLGHIVVKPEVFEKVDRLARGFKAPVTVEPSPPEAVALKDRYLVEYPALVALEHAGISDAAAAYDPYQNSVEVTVYVGPRSASANPRTDTASPLADTASVALKELSVNSEVGYVVKLEYDEPPARPAANVEGGWGYSACTGGFIGVNGSSWGIITAAHCKTKPSTYDTAGTGSTYVATSQRDLRITRLWGGTATNKVRITNGGSFQLMTSVGIVSPGLSLCKWGNTTGYSCDTVESYYGCATYEYCGLYKTVNDNVEAGDSGGPWFYGSRAYAITSGQTPGEASIIAPVSEIGLAWAGTTVKTG